MPFLQPQAHTRPHQRVSELSWGCWSVVEGGSVALAACLLSVGKVHQHSTKVGKLPMGCKRTRLVQMASWKAGLEASIAVQQ